jgi:hypothetical protein
VGGRLAIGCRLYVRNQNIPILAMGLVG